VLAGAGCGPEAPPEPSGAQLSAGTAELRQLLGLLARLEGTPLAHGAERLAARLPDCAALEARAPQADLAALLEGLGCAQPTGALAALHRERGSDALAFAWPLEPGLVLRGRLRLDAAGNAELELRLPRDAAEGARGLWLPGGPPGPAVLSGSETLLHARLRPAAGLDLASLVPDGSQADRLFRLKSELFSGALLDGTWEAAIYLPAAGESMPRAALALGFRQRDAAVAALEALLEQLGRSWPVHRSFFELTGARGACLLDLRILPGLAPCYVAGERTLVLGWNPASLRKALDGAPVELGDAGGLLVELARFAEADARLAAGAASPAALAPAFESPWTRLRAAGGEQDGELRVHVQLEARRRA